MPRQIQQSRRGQNWPPEVLSLLRSIVEGETVTRQEDERTEDAERQAMGLAGTMMDEEQPAWHGDAGWAEREDAYAYGVSLLEAMTNKGYVTEVRLRPVGSHYRVVLRCDGTEYLCARPEHVEYLIGQAEQGIFPGEKCREATSVCSSRLFL